VACPTILFPYLRETISDLIARGGFPPVLLSPISFEALYVQRLQQRQQQQGGEGRASRSRVDAFAFTADLVFCDFYCNGGTFRAVEESGAVLYDAPSREATPVYVLSRDYPLEVLVELDAWAKVRDAAGAISWIEKRQLGERRTVVVTAASADAHLRPEDDAPVAFVASQNVALELLESAPAGWVHVRHADGADGYLRAALVWGI